MMPRGTTTTALTSNSNSTSLSGNFLLHVQVEEDFELDMEEVRALADDGQSRQHRKRSRPSSSSLQPQQHSPSYHSSSSTSIFIGTSNNNNEEGTSNYETKLVAFVTSPLFRRVVYLGICMILLFLGGILTVQNFMTVKTAEDWIEPQQRLKQHGIAAMGEGGDDGIHGGIDWTFGNDAPQPIAISSTTATTTIPNAIEENIVNWAQGTYRLPATIQMDGTYGSIAVNEAVLYNDIPFFWGLPYSGGYIVENAVGLCLNLVQVGSNDEAQLKEEDDNVSSVRQRRRMTPQTMRREEVKEEHNLSSILSIIMVMGKKYLNVDLSTIDGIANAQAIELGSSHMADVIYSPHLNEVASMILTPINRGRLFIIVQHPVEREFAKFHYLRRNNNSNMSYVEFANSEHIVDNWMTRTLVNKGSSGSSSTTSNGILSIDDLDIAKEILRRKALIGLHSHLLHAIRHFVRYFGWDSNESKNDNSGGAMTTPNDDRIQTCLEKAVSDGMDKDIMHKSRLEDDIDLVEEEEGSHTWHTIMKKNQFDYKLYVYAQELYTYQITLS